MCDLAETYHIYDYKSLPVNLVAAFSVGLREESRIKMKMSGAKAPLNTLILAIVADRLGDILWGLSEDGRRGANRPPRLLNEICGVELKEETEIQVFESAEKYEETRKKIMEGR